MTMLRRRTVAPFSVRTAILRAAASVVQKAAAVAASAGWVSWSVLLAGSPSAEAFGVLLSQRFGAAASQLRVVRTLSDID